MLFYRGIYKVLICVIMSHGDENEMVFTSDGKATTVKHILKEFQDESIAGKPKVGQIQKVLIAF